MRPPRATTAVSPRTRRTGSRSRRRSRSWPRTASTASTPSRTSSTSPTRPTTSRPRALQPDVLQQPACGDRHTLPAALASVRAFLAEHAPNGQALFAGLAAYNDATLAQGPPAARSPWAAPERRWPPLVRAHELEPAQASHLVNAAAVASSVGLPSEALAMLDAAERLDDPDRPAMGIGRHAVALNIRGGAGHARPARRGRRACSPPPRPPSHC